MSDQLTISPELLEQAKAIAIASIAEHDKEEQRKSCWVSKAIKWFYTTIVKPLCQIVFVGVKESIVFIINNAENQNLAKIAIVAAAKAGLKGNAAWIAAMTVFRAGKICVAPGKYIYGGQLKENIRETILQLVYTCIKNNKIYKTLLECNQELKKAVESKDGSTMKTPFLDFLEES